MKTVVIIVHVLYYLSICTCRRVLSCVVRVVAVRLASVVYVYAERVQRDAEMQGKNVLCLGL